MIIKLYNRRTRFILQATSSDIPGTVAKAKAPFDLIPELRETPERGTSTATVGDWELTVTDSVKAKVDAL